VQPDRVGHRALDGKELDGDVVGRTKVQMVSKIGFGDVGVWNVVTVEPGEPSLELRTVGTDSARWSRPTLVSSKDPETVPS